MRTFLSLSLITSLAVLSVPALAGPTGAVEHEVTVAAIPTTIDAFVALRDELAKEPFGAAAVFVVAGIMYSQDPALGQQALTVAIDAKWLSKDDKGYKGYAPSKADQQRFKDRWSSERKLDFVPRSYVQGTSPEGAYALPAGPLKIKIREQTNSKENDKTWKVFVHSTGADSPRPMKLVVNDKGIWKAAEWSSLTSGVRPPVVKVADDL